MYDIISETHSVIRYSKLLIRRFGIYVINFFSLYKGINSYNALF